MPAPPIGRLRGGEWLGRSPSPADIFSPERLSDEHRLIARTVGEFVDQDVLPQLEQLEQKDWIAARRLVRKAGELGLLGVDVPEEYGGLALDKITSMIVSEGMSRAASFGATFGAHTNLVVLALVLFGDEDQKQQYLPRLVSGELVGAYCLSEPGSGSDALGAKTRAVRRTDGSFVLNGEKTWITNGGFADLYIVFGKVIDPTGEQFSAFIVDRTTAGVSIGKEEHKMGLHGSSTTPVVLQDVSVPATGVLGEIGKGHKIAFNVLNFARFKLGAVCVGGAREGVGASARYAGERKQFGQTIASFGAIKHKLAEMVVRTYAVESAVYRTVGMIEAQIVAVLPGSATDSSSALAALEEYAVEASIAKVAGSETLDFVLDENIQIHGGNGFVRDYPAERLYRDARVNRIFEGTNEINRLLIPGILARRIARGDTALLEALQASPSHHATAASDSQTTDDWRHVEALKAATRLVFGTALTRYGQSLADEQEVLTRLADMLIDVYCAESGTLRALAARGSSVALQADAARVFVSDAASRIERDGSEALAAMLEGEVLDSAIQQLKQTLSRRAMNATAVRRRIADATVNKGAYIF